MRLVHGAALALLLAVSGSGWELVTHMGPINAVYVEPAKAKDIKVLGSIIDELLAKNGREHAIQIDFFDDRELTPKTRPYPAACKPAYRAKYNFNPANGLDRFVWILPADPNNPTGKLKEVEEKLPH